MQKAAEEAGSRQEQGFPDVQARNKPYQAAVIGIDPETGRVLGYYGGDDPTGTDYGGYLDGVGTGKITGGQSPGSSFKIYTLAAGLGEPLLQDTWDGTKRARTAAKSVTPAPTPADVCRWQRSRYCDYETATIHSYNFPFYWIADKIGRDKVIAAAKAAGLKHMFTDDGK